MGLLRGRGFTDHTVVEKYEGKKKEKEEEEEKEERRVYTALCCLRWNHTSGSQGLSHGAVLSQYPSADCSS